MRELGLWGQLLLVNHHVWKALVGLAQRKGKELAAECLAACLLAAAEDSTVEGFLILETVLVTIAHLVDRCLRSKLSR